MGRSHKKHIQSELTDEVWLSCGDLAWTRLSSSLRRELLSSIERIAEIRANIGAHAMVSSMPAVEGICELWRNDVGTIDGRMNVLPLKGATVFGVQLPAQTLLCGNDAVLRSVLVHEFSHCFYSMCRVVAMVSAGITEDTDRYDITDDNEDRKRMVIPADWFGEEDCASIIYHDDKYSGTVLDESFRRLRDSFRVTEIDSRYHTEKVNIADDVWARAEELNKVVRD